MSALDLIATVKSALGSESEWSQGSNARDAQGLPCPILNPNAVKFDLYGSLYKAWWDSNPTNYLYLNEAYKLLEEAIPADFINRDIESWNDSVQFSAIGPFLNGIQ